MRILRLHSPVNLGGEFDFLPKGDYVIGGNGTGGVDEVVLKHWLVKAMINDGLAVIIEKSDTDKKAKTAEPAADKTKTNGKRGRKNNVPAPDEPDGKPEDDPDAEPDESGDGKDGSTEDGSAEEGNAPSVE